LFTRQIIVLRPGDAAPFPLDPRLTGIVIAYSNPAMIADQVLPRVPVAKKEFKWLKHKLTDGFSIPDTKVGRKAGRNQVEFSASEETSSTEDFGLDDIVPQDDIANAPDGYDPLGYASEGIANLLMLDREKRAADVVFNADNYAAANKATLSGDDRFSSTASTPISTILTAMDAMVMRPNVLVFGQAVWTKFRQHPEIVSAILGNSGTKGIVTREQVAALFEVQQILVGQSFLNTAKKGQAASLARVWGKYLAMLNIDNLANATNRVTYGITAQFGTKVARSEFTSKYGLNGATVVTAGESVKELVMANDLGYLFSNAVA